MWVKLISPRMSLRPMDSEYKRLLSPSISLLVLASLTPSEHRVTIEDENAGDLDLDDSPSLVGISVNIDTSGRAYRLADHYRSRGIPVVLGGIHASACPDEASVHADAVCIGEAEDLWATIVNDAAAGRLRAKYFSDHPADPSKTPMPAWHLIQRDRYLYSCIVCASRGCPFECDFCYNSCDYVHNCYRNRPLAEVLAEIRQLPTRQVMFIDDNFIGNLQWARNFVRAAKSMNLTWHAAVSTNIMNHTDLMDEMAESGCRSLFIGFESINGASVAGVNKSQNKVERFEGLIQTLHDRDIMVNASMVFGFDEDHLEVFPQTLDWLVRNKVETMTGHILTPYPGTRLHQRLVEEGRMIDNEPTHYNTSKVVFRPRNMTPEQLQEGYLGIYRKFYSLPSILKRLPGPGKRRIPYLLFNLGYRRFGKVTSLVARLGLMGACGRLARRLSYGIQ